jgi:hypothetical protein
MTQHLHEVFVPGCFRCELSADEAADNDPIRYTFSMPCTVELSDKPGSDEELRQRLAEALRQQLGEQDERIGDIFENILELT